MGKKGGGKQVTTTAVDQATQDYQNRIHKTAGDAAGGYTTVGPNGATTDALAQYQKYADGGLNGLAALGGDPAAMQRFQNPYQQQVVDASNKNFEQTNQIVGNQADSQATAAGAFGGSRAAVQKGAAQGQAQAAHDQQIAGLLDQGYSNAQNVAGQTANLGFGATGQMANIGDYLRNISQQQSNPDAARLQLLQQGVTNPNSTTTTEKMPNKSPWSTVAGLATTGLGLFSGGGIASKAAGLFGGGGYDVNDPNQNMFAGG